MVNNSFDDARRSPEIGVGGGAPGINAAIEIAGGWTVIVLANFDPPSAGTLARGAMDIIRGHRNAEQPAGGAVVRRRAPVAPAKTELDHAEVAPATAQRARVRPSGGLCPTIILGDWCLTPVS